MLTKSQLSLGAVLMIALPAWAGVWNGGWGSNNGSGSESDNPTFYRIDCRYHGHEGDHDDDKDKDKDKDFNKDRLEKWGGAGFCYGSAVYRLDGKEFRDVHLAIGCDNRTLFNDEARVHQEMTLDRFQPNRAATPAIEVFPHAQLVTEGTYTSVLDISYGRFKGLCYVHQVKYEDMGKKN
jgi:hypothetical protein